MAPNIKLFKLSQNQSNDHFSNNQQHSFVYAPRIIKIPFVSINTLHPFPPIISKLLITETPKQYPHLGKTNKQPSPPSLNHITGLVINPSCATPRKKYVIISSPTPRNLSPAFIHFISPYTLAARVVSSSAIRPLHL